ncbi:WGR domain-containing protein [Paracoccus laeviglucosivorans]|uniref:WGR domain-containing protein, predicted DNA-binding domain in MolR n=1 Tax=Paracoccus laeviglucosivorans TaxID=1197861 RepID=A0A521FN05_9RHOB|nr:WGR domain-containing protein [Paracoccus laeviglucosivorans]SMO97593.1 WGR domain-containing protein, predicted DNA-binding domain in MolR [Paracoccus laeviglucosivorans]
MSGPAIAPTDTQIEMFPRELQLQRHDPARNMRRYYRMSVERDLFGGASLIREWGRIGARGQRRIEAHLDEGEAVSALLKLARTKRRKGYAG